MVAIRLANRVAKMIAKRVAIANRVANRVVIAIRNPETFLNGGYDQGCDQERWLRTRL